MGRIRTATQALPLVAALALAACGGGGGTATTTSTEGDAGAPTTFAAYARRGAESPPVPALSPAQADEVAMRSRSWAAEQLAAGPADAFVLPSLHFARVQAVAAAASGSTLAQLRAAVPAPSAPVVQAALLQGLSRTLRAGADSTPADDFMADVTARGVGGTWQSLSLSPLSAGELALQPQLRLSVADQLSLQLAWPQAQAFGGVFENARGERVLAQMVRASGPLKDWTDGGAAYAALAMTSDRWLVRITPPAGAPWGAAELAAAVAAAQAGVADARRPAAQGDLVLPLETAFQATGTADRRGMDEAQSRTQADLRRLDGQGGSYAVLPMAEAAMSLRPGWLQLSGLQQVDFLAAPDNRFSGGSETTMPVFRWGATCGATDLRPAVLALIGAHGRVEMLARFASSDGSLCQN